MKRLVVAALIVALAVWGFRWWEARPAAEPPTTVWTCIPFRGPEAFAEPGKGAPIDDVLVALSPEPLLEAPQKVPSAHVLLRQPASWLHDVAVALDWRKPFTSVSAMSPADLAAWRVRYYTFTGKTQLVGSKKWGEYALDVPQPTAAR